MSTLSAIKRALAGKPDPATGDLTGHFAGATQDDLILLAIHGGTVHSVTLPGSDFQDIPEAAQDLLEFAADRELLRLGVTA